jgi:BirA family biotin operon repressor/biotin-[acetyl-CoA-carboxylase] ligase
MSGMTEHAASAALANRWLWMPHAGSTNDELVALTRAGSRDDVPDFTVIATDDQRSGRGRLGRAWVSPPRACVAASVLVRPSAPSGRPFSPAAWGWFPLLAGLAMTRAIAQFLPRAESVGVKWPNDVLIDGRKVCGILCELVIDASGAQAVVIGTGVNLTLTQAELPVDTATSLALVGASATDVDTVLAAYLTHLHRLVRVFESAEGDVRSSGLHDDVVRVCDTVGRRIRVELSDASIVMGSAESLDDHGQLCVTLDTPAQRAGEAFVVGVGDVTHVRVV